MIVISFDAACVNTAPEIAALSRDPRKIGQRIDAHRFWHVVDADEPADVKLVDGLPGWIPVLFSKLAKKLKAA